MGAGCGGGGGGVCCEQPASTAGVNTSAISAALRSNLRRGIFSDIRFPPELRDSRTTQQSGLTEGNVEQTFWFLPGARNIGLGRRNLEIGSTRRAHRKPNNENLAFTGA